MSQLVIDRRIQLPAVPEIFAGQGQLPVVALRVAKSQTQVRDADPTVRAAQSVYLSRLRGALDVW